MTKVILALWLAIAPILSFAQPKSDADLLLAQLSQLTQLQGRFSQRQYGQDKLMLAESSGNFSYPAAGLFCMRKSPALMHNSLSLARNTFGITIVILKR